jgi:hypothetical protein
MTCFIFGTSGFNCNIETELHQANAWRVRWSKHHATSSVTQYILILGPTWNPLINFHIPYGSIPGRNPATGVWLDFRVAVEVVSKIIIITFIRSAGLWRWYINIADTTLGIIHRPGFYLKIQFKSIGLSVPHMKHIASPLLAQQVNAICRFVTMVY